MYKIPEGDAISKPLSEKPVLYIHVGANKTGTTALQSFLNTNREVLIEKGLLYPATGMLHSAHYKISNHLGYGPNIANEEVDLFREAFLKEVRESKCKKIVISSEYFILSKKAANVKEFFSDFEVKIIIYLRRHDHWVESLYNQAVKTAENPPWEKGIENFIRFQIEHSVQEFDYYRLVGVWAETFGPENIIVKAYEKQQFVDENIYSDFLSIFGLGRDARMQQNKKNLNSSIPVVFLDIVDSLNRMKDVDSRLRKMAINKIAALESHAADMTCLSPQRRREVVEKYGESYAEIAQKYLNRSSGELFFEPIACENTTWKESPNATLPMALGLMISLMKN